MESLERHPSLVLKAAPGAGKTTRVPPALLRSRFGQKGEILVLEPRRLAAKLSALRVAEELGEEVGQTVGYQFRMERVMGPETRLKFLTEGMLMRRLLSDPELRGVSAVVLDEFHERHLHTDLAIALVRKIQSERRPELRILVMSATLETEGLSAYLGDAPVIEVEGRAFPVEIQHLQKPSEKPLEQLVAEQVERALGHPEYGSGDILVFLSGMAEIRRAEQAVGTRLGRERALVFALHGELSREEQNRAIRGGYDRPKVILSTNVAETSLTLPGIRTVIDSGLARQAAYSWWSGVPSLQTRPISRASATQRAGRAGRTSPGQCYRLYTLHEFETRVPYERPEIQRADLSQTLLELAKMGISDPGSFRWFEAPLGAALEAARELLQKLGALDAQGRITEAGKIMVELPLHPRLARVVLSGGESGCLEDAVTWAAALSETRQWLQVVPDRLPMLDGTARWLRERVLEGISRARGFSKGSSKGGPVARAILTGYPDRVARKRKLASQLTRGGPGGAHEPRLEFVFSQGGTAQTTQTGAFEGHEYFVVIDAQERREERRGVAGAPLRTEIRLALPIEEGWLFELGPEAVVSAEELRWDDRLRRVEITEQLRYGGLVLEESRSSGRGSTGAAALLIEQVFGKDDASLERLQEGWEALEKEEEWVALFSRCQFLSSERAELGLPAWRAPELRALLRELAQGSVSEKELKEADLLNQLFYQLTEEQRQALDRLAPEWIQLPRGRRVRIHYELGKPPWAESRIQDFFGMRAGPSVLAGAKPVTLHLLAPNQRPIQVTSDLAGFWTRDYPGIRKELGRRYPRHFWPEDPLNPGEPPPRR